TISRRPTSVPRVTPAERTKRGEGIVIVMFSSAFGFTSLPVRLGGLIPRSCSSGRGEVSPKSPGEVTFISRSVAMTCFLSLFGPAGKTSDGLKPSGGDVLKPRKRSSVIFSGNIHEQLSPDRRTVRIISEEKPDQNALRRSAVRNRGGQR